MKAIVLGAGMMGRAIAYDLQKYSNFDSIAIADKDKKTINDAKNFFKKQVFDYRIIDAGKTTDLKKHFKKC